MKNFSTKLLLKVLDPVDDKIKWVHLCYIDEDLYNQYICEKELQSKDLNETLARWCKEDFCIDLAMSSTKDIHLLRAAIKDFYSRVYPEVYVKSETDRQGWVRIWVTKKIKEDLQIYGKHSG